MDNFGDHIRHLVRSGQLIFFLGVTSITKFFFFFFLTVRCISPGTTILVILEILLLYTHNGLLRCPRRKPHQYNIKSWGKFGESTLPFTILLVRIIKTGHEPTYKSIKKKKDKNYLKRHLHHNCIPNNIQHGVKKNPLN